MIITCEECSTSFNLDDSLLKETGSKVRCSVCKNVFTAYPAAISEEPGGTEPEAETGLFFAEPDLSDDSQDADTGDAAVEADEADGDPRFQYLRVGRSRVCHVRVHGVGSVKSRACAATAADCLVVADPLVAHKNVIHGSLAGGHRSQSPE